MSYMTGTWFADSWSQPGGSHGYKGLPPESCRTVTINGKTSVLEYYVPSVMELIYIFDNYQDIVNMIKNSLESTYSTIRDNFSIEENDSITQYLTSTKGSSPNDSENDNYGNFYMKFTNTVVD